MRDQLNGVKATIEDLQMGQLRLVRYDEYFADSQKKLNVLDIHMRVFDKRLTDDIATVTANRDKMINKI